MEPEHVFLKMLVLGSVLMHCLGWEITDHNPSSVFCTSTGWWRHLWHWVCVSWCSNRLLFIITASILDGWLNRMNLKTNMHESTAMTCKSVIISHLNGARGSKFKCQPGRYLSSSISRKALRICNSQEAPLRYKAVTKKRLLLATHLTGRCWEVIDKQQHLCVKGSLLLLAKVREKAKPCNLNLAIIEICEDLEIYQSNIIRIKDIKGQGSSCIPFPLWEDQQILMGNIMTWDPAQQITTW